MLACEPECGCTFTCSCTEQSLCPLAGQIFNHVHMFAAAVVTASRVAFGVLVGQNGTHGLQHRRTGVVLAGDHLQPSRCRSVSAWIADQTVRVLMLQQIHDGHSPPGKGFRRADGLPAPAAHWYAVTQRSDFWLRMGSVNRASWTCERLDRDRQLRPRLSPRRPARSLTCRNNTPVVLRVRAVRSRPIGQRLQERGLFSRSVRSGRTAASSIPSGAPS